MTQVYRYRAARIDGTIEEGLADFTGRIEAMSSLRSRGLLPVSIEPSVNTARGRELPSGEVAVGLRTLATLLDAGLPLARALAAFEDVAPPRWRASIPSLRDRVREGDGLGAALDRSNAGIPTLMIGVIRAGENGSGLSSAVRRAAELAEARAALRASIRAALAYPMVLGVVGAASMAIIVGVVLPRFAAIIADVGGAVPPLARAIVSVGGFARTASIPALIAFIMGAILWQTWASDRAARVRVHRALLHLPVVGSLRLASASSRLCAALSALLDAGVPAAAALHHAAGAAGDLEIESRVLGAREQVIGGARISAALVAANAVTPTAGRLIRAGEESGQVAQMLQRAGALDAARLGETMKALVRVIEPAMIIVFAGMIAVVCGALLQTVYSVRP
jgi:general secretion pathway protein F